ncbi:MAG: cysteine desulfurase [Phycisphaeraceae bacterium]|nr:cysteine desulfurase [Phycisphaeraceae bacterium]
MDVERVRQDFPILQRQVHGQPLVYLDNAATTQKPRAVIDALSRFYEGSNSNVHRGVHALSQEATDLFESARQKIGRFLNTRKAEEVILVRGTTEGLNLVAQSYARPRLKAGDQILISGMEHHSNIVPWQMVCQQTGAELKVAPINERGELIMEEFVKLLSAKTKVVSVVHVSNALGTVNPVRQIVELAHRVGAIAVLDGAQAVAHAPVDVRALDCDFYAFSGHKLYGPTGIGALYGRAELLEAMPPWQGGGDMIKSVTFAQTIYNDLPYKFEAGTPDVAGAVGLGAAIDYLQAVGIEQVAAHEADLLAYGTQLLSDMEGVRLIGTAAHKAGVLGFVVEGAHAHDVGTILDSLGIAVRTGHHCAQPVMDFFNLPATARASLAMYNRREELDALAEGLREVVKVFA